MNIDIDALYIWVAAVVLTMVLIIGFVFGSLFPQQPHDQQKTYMVKYCSKISAIVVKIESGEISAKGSGCKLEELK